MLQDLNITLESLSKNSAITYEQIGDSFIGKANLEDPIWKSSLDYLKEHPIIDVIKVVERGIYNVDLNFENSISHISDFEGINCIAFSKKGEVIDYKADLKELFQSISTYGVADNIEQIKKKYKNLIKSDNSFVITITEIRKDEQPEEDGWRWEKWGSYIGKQRSFADYLYNEPHIESVFVFSVIPVKQKPTLVPEIKKQNLKP